MVGPSTSPRFGDYQSNVALPLAKKLSKKPRDIAKSILEKLDVSGICEAPTIAGPGFVNLKLDDEFVSRRLKGMVGDKQRLGIGNVEDVKKIVVDFSGPNIAKDMHVGHLRSTIIGDTLARVLEFLGHDVLRLNHTGDWGTQFGMLITYMKRNGLMGEGGDGDVGGIGDLVELYKKARVCFDEDEEFKKESLNEVVKLQGGNEESRKSWKRICEASRVEFEKIYKRLDVKLTERGESFYNPMLKGVVEDLEEKDLAVESEGATVVFLEGNKFRNREGKPQPVLVRKSDGGFLYATTDLAAIKYRTETDKANRIIYVTDNGQSLHFEQVYQVARRANLTRPDVSLEHVGFGLVQGEDGKKFKTRSGETVKLSGLLDEAERRAKIEFLRKREERAASAENGDPVANSDDDRSEEEIDKIAKVIGIAAVKYADLKNNRTKNYKFSYDKMVKMEGDTAPYMLYAYARVKGIYRNTGEGVEDATKFVFEKNEERALAKHLLRLPEVLIDLERDLYPSVLCEYLKSLTTIFNQFYEQCSVRSAPSEEIKRSRLTLCGLTADTLELSLGLLGIKVLDRM